MESYLKSPVALKPFSTIEVFIAANDVRGGTGANFVVDWAATGEIAEPTVEALMVGGVGSRALCLHQPGAADQDRQQELACRKDATSAAFSTKNKPGVNIHVYRNPLRFRTIAARRIAGAGGAVDGPRQIQFRRRQQ